MQDSDTSDPFGGSSFLGLASASRARRQQGTLSNVRVFGPTAVNEFRASYVGIIRRSVPASDALPVESLSFISGASTLGLNNAGPAGYGGSVHLTKQLQFRQFRTSNVLQHTYQIGDSFSRISGRHTLRFGVDFRYYQLNRRDGGGLLGQFSFRGTETGYDVADYLLGAPTTFSQASLQVIDSRSKYAAANLQDSIRVRPSLTVNLGLRWEMAQPWYDTQDKIVAMVPGQQSTQFPKAPRGLVYPGDDGVPRTLAPTRYKNFAPRAGIAWSPSVSDGFLAKLLGKPGTTSIRMGSGIFFNAIQDQTLYWIIGTAPFGNYWLAPEPVLFEEPYRTRSTGQSEEQRFPFEFPVPGSPESRETDFSPFLPLSSTLGYKTDNSLPYGIHFNLMVQRQLVSSMVLSVGYVGAMGRKLLSIVENNPGDPNLCMSLRGDGVKAGTLECGPFQADATFTRPDGSLVHETRTTFGPNFSTGYWEATWASSSYNSLQTSLERRGGDATFLIGYTWSKALDNGSFFNDRMNVVKHSLNKSLSNFDSTHNFVASYVYEIPFHRTFSGSPQALVRGWSFAGITRLPPDSRLVSSR